MEKVKKQIFFDDELVVSILNVCPRKAALLCQIALRELIEKYGLNNANPEQMKKFFEYYQYMKSSNVISQINSIVVPEKPKKPTVKPVFSDDDELVNMSDKEKMASIMESW